VQLKSPPLMAPAAPSQLTDATSSAGSRRRYQNAGLLPVRLAQPGRDALLARVAKLFATEPVHQWHGCLVVATDHTVGVKRPA
jgi:hypothetical protein